MIFNISLHSSLKPRTIFYKTFRYFTVLIWEHTNQHVVTMCNLICIFFDDSHRWPGDIYKNHEIWIHKIWSFPLSSNFQTNFIWVLLAFRQTIRESSHVISSRVSKCNRSNLSKRGKRLVFTIKVFNRVICNIIHLRFKEYTYHEGIPGNLNHLTLKINYLLID